MTSQKPLTSAHQQPSALPVGLVAYQPSGYPDLASAQTTAATGPAVPVAPFALPAGTTRRAPSGTTVAAGAGQLELGQNTRRPRNRLLVAAAAVAVAVLAAAGLLVTTATNTAPPQHVVESFFAALADRDGRALRAFDVCADSPLCDTGALRTGYQPPQHLRILATGTDSSGTANPAHDRRDKQLLVTVRYDIGGRSYEDNLGLTRYAQGWLRHSWHITTPPGAHLQLTSAYVDYAHVAGIGVPITTPSSPPATNGNLSAGTTPDGMWAPPGQYAITTTGDQLVAAAHLDITIATDHHVDPITIPAALNAGIEQQVTQQTHRYLDQCAAQPTLHPALGSDLASQQTCPFSYDSPYTITDNPQWTIKRYPTTAVHIQPDATVTLTTVTPGEAALHYRWTLDVIEPRRWTTDTNTQTFTISGPVRADNGAIVWSP